MAIAAPTRRAPVRRAPARTTPAARPAIQAPATPAANGSIVDIHRRVKFEYVDLNDITPYPYNARDNEKAIPAVAESIKAFGFLIPCVVDANNVLVAGHTRTEAAKLLGMTEVPCVRAEHLTPEQVNAFRLIDNKVASIATWDYDLLAQEINNLADTGIQWTAFGWTQDEIDCLSDVVQADCLEAQQVAETAQNEAAAHSQRRSPTTARFVLGEVTFFIQSSAYRNWVDGIRQLHNFNEANIVADLKQRLGILE